MGPVELLDALVEVLIGDWGGSESELRRLLAAVAMHVPVTREKTYASVEDLGVLAIRESLSPGGIMLADPKSWADLCKSLRLRVQRPAGRHFECTLRVGRSMLKMFEMCGRAKKL